jgi:hypothetical protein
MSDGGWPVHYVSPIFFGDGKAAWFVNYAKGVAGGGVLDGDRVNVHDAFVGLVDAAMSPVAAEAFASAFPEEAARKNFLHHRLLSFVVPAMTGVFSKPGSLGDSLRLWSDMLLLLDGLGQYLPMPETVAWKMLAFNQVVSPSVFRMQRRELEQADDAGLLGAVARAVLSINSRDMRRWLEREQPRSGLKQGMEKWTYYSWALWQPVSGAREDPRVWGGEGNETALFRELSGHYARDMESLVRTLVLAGGAGQEEALRAMLSDGSDSIRRYFGSGVRLRFSDLRGDWSNLVPAPGSPVKLCSLISIYKRWRQDLGSLAREWSAPPKLRIAPVGTVAEGAGGGLRLEMDMNLPLIFKPKALEEEQMEFVQLFGSLLVGRVEHLGRYVSRMSGIPGVRVEERTAVRRELAAEGFFPMRARTPGEFWSSLLLRGLPVVDGLLADYFMRYFGRGALWRQLVLECKALGMGLDQAGKIWRNAEVSFDGEAFRFPGTVEALFLGAGKASGLEEAEARCLAFRMGMGSKGGVRDFTSEWFVRAREACRPGSRDVIDGFLSGGSGVAVSAFSQWSRRLNEEGGDAPDSVFKFVLQPGSPPVSLGTCLGSVGFWRSLLDGKKGMAEWFSARLAGAADYAAKHVAAFEPAFGEVGGMTAGFLRAGMEEMSAFFEKVSGQPGGLTLWQDFSSWWKTSNSGDFAALQSRLSMFGKADVTFEFELDRLARDLVGLDLPRLGLGSISSCHEASSRCLFSGAPQFAEWLALNWDSLAGGFWHAFGKPSSDGLDMADRLCVELNLSGSAVQSYFRRNHAVSLLSAVLKDGAVSQEAGVQDLAMLATPAREAFRVWAGLWSSHRRNGVPMPAAAGAEADACFARLASGLRAWKSLPGRSALLSEALDRGFASFLASSLVTRVVRSMAGAYGLASGSQSMLADIWRNMMVPLMAERLTAMFYDFETLCCKQYEVWGPQRFFGGGRDKGADFFAKEVAPGLAGASGASEEHQNLEGKIYAKVI